MRTSLIDRLLWFLMGIALFGVLIGCGETVLIPPGTVVRLAAPTVATISTSDGSGGWVVQKQKVTLPEGYYVVPPPATQP